MQKNNSRVNVLGVGINPANMNETVATIMRWVDRNEKQYVCVTGVHGVMECQKDKHLEHIHNTSGLTVPDGMPMVWIGRLQGFAHISRVYGPDLMTEVCKASVQKGYSHFLYGGNFGVAGALKKILEERFPGIRILGTYTPPFRPLNDQEEVDLFKQVEQTKPDIFWVGLSTPKQEKFMAAYIQKLNTKVMLGVGAAFDVHTGNIKDAPDWIKITGMQWMHRLSHEPRRLWRRYLYNNPAFVYKFFKQMLTQRI